MNDYSKSLGIDTNIFMYDLKIIKWEDINQYYNNDKNGYLELDIHPYNIPKPIMNGYKYQYV
jgi:hypothetical protein